ncbi:MAG: Fe(3+) ABC transporter substrate-binding protein [Pseudomonadales bacterium]|nr:Fe(3+) ABC transporter substrate-binding protein [Pseudomonadales bacterium]NRA16346.1 Fe(3+) ABC transporter substrate-binding protein [Oceanospirillaceae bacterium]
MIKNFCTTFLLLATTASILTSQTVLANGEVNVYSARKEALIKPLLDKFSQSTGINVNLITGKADALLQRLKIEGKASPADIFITVDAGRLHRAKQAGVLQPIDSAVLNKNIPAHLRDADNLWFGLSQRARTIFYAVDRVNPSELSSYEDLASSQWRGRICLRSSNNIYNQSLVASMIENIGADKTETWAKQIVANMAKPPSGGDTDQLKAVAAGVCDITIANTYYYGRLSNSTSNSDQQLVKKVKIFWPNQDNRGVHMNVSGAGVTKFAKHKENAIKLIEFMSSAESQAWYAAVNSEFPVLKSAEISATLKSWGGFSTDPIPLNKLGENNRSAVELMDRAGWK